MSKFRVIDDYSQNEEPQQGTGTFNLSRRDFELFKDGQLNGDVFHAKLVDRNIAALLNKKEQFVVDLTVLTDSERVLLSGVDGFQIVIKSLKAGVRTFEEFRAHLERVYGVV
jgi:hypothetical protein